MDQLHQDISFVLRFRNRAEELRYLGAVDVVPTAFTLRFQNVICCCFRAAGEREALGFREGVLGCEGGAQSLQCRRRVVGEQRGEMIWAWWFGGQDLLDLLTAGEM